MGDHTDNTPTGTQIILCTDSDKPEYVAVLQTLCPFAAKDAALKYLETREPDDDDDDGAVFKVFRVYVGHRMLSSIRVIKINSIWS